MATFPLQILEKVAPILGAFSLSIWDLCIYLYIWNHICMSKNIYICTISVFYILVKQHQPPSSPHPTVPNEVSAPWWLRFEANANRPPLCWTWVRLAAGDYQKLLLMIFGWVFGGLLAKSELDDAKLITDHFILNLVSLPNLVVICSGWDVSFIGHVRNEGQVMLPHANQLHSWEIHGNSQLWMGTGWN